MTELNYDQQTFMARYIHPEKTYPVIGEETIAAILGIPLPNYRQIKEEFALAVSQTADELLAESSFAARVDRLPFAPGSTVLGLGDSITDDSLSWIELLRQLLTKRRSSDHIRVINAGISGETTTQMVNRTYYQLAAEKPAWIICMAGTNDAHKYGENPLKTLVSPEETEKNLVMLRSFGATRTSAQWVWITPNPVIPEDIRSHWFVGYGQTIWTNEDLAPVIDAIRRQKDPVVDLQKVFGVPPNPEYVKDGLHPSPIGQKAIVRALVEQLT